MQRTFFASLVLGCAASVALAQSEELVARVDLKFLKETELVTGYLCLGDSADDCAPWANAYLYEARVREVISGEMPKKKFLAIYGVHALKKMDFKGVVGKFNKLNEGVDGAEYQLVEHAIENPLTCFRWSGQEGNGPAELTTGGKLLQCYGPATAHIRAYQDEGLQVEPEKTLRAANEAYNQALIAGDVAALEKIFAEEFIYTSPSGEISDRKAQLEQFRSKMLDITSGQGGDEVIRVRGKMGVVVGRFDARGMHAGMPFDVTERYTSVWVIRDGRWQLIAEQGTLRKSESK